MEDPYITKISGISYEKTAIMEWLTKNNTCPITRIPLTLEMLQPNRALKDSIETIKAQFGDAIVKKICVSESITNVTSIYDGNDLMVSVKIPDVLHRTSKELCIAIDTSGSTGVNVTILNEQGSSETYNLTILDLLIHAAKTLINCLENYDYLSIVSYSTHAKIVIERKLMTDTNKKLAIDEIVIKHGKLPAKAFPGRSAILIKLLNLDETVIFAVYEKPGSMKIGKYVPGTRIPILSDDDLQDRKKPLINLAWHISDEIHNYLKGNNYEGPIIDILSKDDFIKK